FFFSSRRRHTRFSRDWSSDVCSSDLCSSFEGCFSHAARTKAGTRRATKAKVPARCMSATLNRGERESGFLCGARARSPEGAWGRSEERRVGRECKAQWVRNRREEGVV